MNRTVLITTHEAALLLGVSDDSVRHYIHAGRLRRIGTRHLDLAQVEQLHAAMWPDPGPAGALACTTAHRTS